MQLGEVYLRVTRSKEVIENSKVRAEGHLHDTIALLAKTKDRIQEKHEKRQLSYLERKAEKKAIEQETAEMMNNIGRRNVRAAQAKLNRKQFLSALKLEIENASNAGQCLRSLEEEVEALQTQF
jgi:hypothetical protein